MTTVFNFWVEKNKTEDYFPIFGIKKENGLTTMDKTLAYLLLHVMQNTVG